ncbi:hypothetical protein D3C75_599520 [compost metagenome]
MLLEQQRAGGDVVQRQCTDHHRRGAGTWNAEGQHRHQRTASRATDGGFRRREAAHVTLAESTLGTRHAFFGHVGHGTGQGRTGTRQYAHDETQYTATDVHHEHRRRFLEVEHHPAGGFNRFLAVVGFFQQQEDFADGEQAQHQHDELDTVGQVNVVPGEAIHTAVGVDADGRQEQTDQRRDERLQRTVAGHAAEADNRKYHQYKIFRGAEGNRPFRQQRGEQHHAAGRDKGTDERAPCRQRQCYTGQAFAGHRVTVEGGHHGGRFTRNVQQNRADPAAVFATQVHRRQQDQCRLRWQAEGECDRNQQRHAVDRPQAWQQADHCTDQGSAECSHQVVRAQRDAETLTQIAKSIHISSPERRARPRAAVRPSTCRTAGRGRRPSS